MSLKTDLGSYCGDVFRSAWTTRDGTVVPDEDSKLGLKNEAIKIDGTVLYADLADSTRMVDDEIAGFAAEVYKAFLYCCARIIPNQGGTVTAYDGDRIMGVFIGKSKNTSAVQAALNIKWAVDEIVMPKMKAVYTTKSFQVKHVTGIDTSELFVAKTGARGANDLVWVGRSANYAAKLSALDPSYTYITSDVYNAMHDDVKFVNGTPMWIKMIWTEFNNSYIYRSSYRRSFS